LLRVTNNVLSNGTVVSEAGHFLVRASTNVRLSRHLFIIAASIASTARMFEAEHADALPNLPLLRSTLADLHDRACGLVGRGDWRWGTEDALEHLKVGVAESCGTDFDQDLVVFDLRYWDVLELVGLIVLRSKVVSVSPILSGQIVRTHFHEPGGTHRLGNA